MRVLDTPGASSILERVGHVHDSSCSICGLVPIALHRRKRAEVVAESPAMRVLMKRVARFASSDAPVVVYGETGTGKEVVARTLHHNGPRASQPFVAVNVAALPAELLESELFGHAKGAFTGASSAKRGLLEEAEGGTLFLDEIGEMPLPLQAKLLRALQDGEVRRLGETRPFAVDVRIVCATHRDLRALVQQGAFREDLYFRLHVLTLRVPPLRERREDILPLAQSLLDAEPTPVRRISREAEERLLAHAWPGNVRELGNAIQYGVALTQGHEISVDDLPEGIGPSATPPGPAAPDLRSLVEVEREHILRVLDACGGSQSEAARVLGIGRNTLWRKLREYAGEG